MKYKAGLLLAAMTLVSGFAQSEADHAVWMKTIMGNMGATRKGIEAKSPEAAVSAGKVAEAFDKVHGFWTAKGADDAVQSAQTAKAAALETAKLVQSGDFEKAGQSFGTVGGSCKGCHDAHREKAADGSWKIK
jgi:cytochrome c556